MIKLFEEAIQGVTFTGDIKTDSYSLFLKHGLVETAEHCIKVAKGAAELAGRFGLNIEKALTAGYLHDISQIIPKDKMVQAANELGLYVYPEEEELPTMLHQRLSRNFANEVFHIGDTDILDAIECHTTLKATPKPMDMVLLLADKLSWNKEFNEKFAEDIMKGLGISLESGAYAYVRYINESSDSKVLHPWVVEANYYLSRICK